MPDTALTGFEPALSDANGSYFCAMQLLTTVVNELVTAHAMRRRVL